ncbi:hypothetical protein Sm713_01320 [Streptomyces sp. TS71-3]|nr:hypothetical protein Sm713_01320 [Streptomyces sp. TS71-3]
MDGSGTRDRDGGVDGDEDGHGGRTREGAPEGNPGAEGEAQAPRTS